MALLIFPASPPNGLLYPAIPAVGQQQYKWDAANNTWVLEGTGTGVVAGCYGDASTVPSFCVDAVGRITSVTNVPLPSTLTVVSAPATQGDSGSPGDVAYDASWFYWYDGALWQRVAADPVAW